MPKKYDLRTAPLNPDELIFVEGEVTFSKVSRWADDKEIQEQNYRDRQRGYRYPQTKPFITITIKDPKIANLAPNGQLTINQDWVVSDKIYTSKTTGEQRFSIKIDQGSDKSKLPTIYELQANGTYVPVELNGEFDTGLKVILCMQPFVSRNYGNMGVGLNAIYVKEPIRLFGNNSQMIPTELQQQLGLVIDTTAETKTIGQPMAQPTTQTVQPTVQPTAQTMVQPTVTQPTAQPIVQTTVQPMVQPTTQPVAQQVQPTVAQPSTQPFTQPAMQPPVQQPVVQPQPGMQPNAVIQPQPGVNNANDLTLGQFQNAQMISNDDLPF